MISVCQGTRCSPCSQGSNSHLSVSSPSNKQSLSLPEMLLNWDSSKNCTSVQRGALRSMTCRNRDLNAVPVWADPCVHVVSQGSSHRRAHKTKHVGSTVPLILGLNYNEPNSLRVVLKLIISILTVIFHSLALFCLQLVVQCDLMQVLKEMKNSLGFWKLLLPNHLTALDSIKGIQTLWNQWDFSTGCGRF